MYTLDAAEIDAASKCENELCEVSRRDAEKSDMDRDRDTRGGESEMAELMKQVKGKQMKGKGTKKQEGACLHTCQVVTEGFHFTSPREVPLCSPQPRCLESGLERVTSRLASAGDAGRVW